MTDAADREGLAPATAVPQWPFLSPDGRRGGFVRFAGRGEPVTQDGPYSAGVYAGSLAAPARRIAGTPSAPPVIDPSGRRLLFGFDLDGATRLCVAHLDRALSHPAPLAEIEGSLAQLAFDAGGSRVLALVAEPGADTASLTSGKRHARRVADPEVDEGHTGTQRLVAVDVASGRSSMIGPTRGCVWEFAPCPDGTIVAVCSEEPGEAAWYGSFVGRLDPHDGSLRPLYRPQWQITGLCVDPGSGAMALAEGWASDRGLVAGRVVLLAPDGSVRQQIDDLEVDVTWLAYDERGRLFFAGWHDLDTAWGWIGPDGRRQVHHEHGGLVGSPWRPSLALSGDGSVALACRSDEQTPPEVVVLAEDGSRRSWADGAPTRSFLGEVTTGAWEGGGGTEIHGLLCSPTPEAASSGAKGALVVLAHGGPTLSYHHSFDPGRSGWLLAEGFSVLLANQRGGVGRGDAFARGNHGDPGGHELEDVLAGARWAASEHLVPAGLPAIMGWSYGGYLSAFAATTRSDICCAVVGAGMSDLASCRHTCNNAPFYDLLMGGTPADEEVRDLYVERSAVYRARAVPVPTLIVHGEEDRCVPIGQAHELFQALRAAGAEVEMATYPREGHQVSEPDHVADYHARATRFLLRHLSRG